MPTATDILFGARKKRESTIPSPHRPRSATEILLGEARQELPMWTDPMNREEPVEDRGLLAEGASLISRGVVGAGETALRAARALDPAGGIDAVRDISTKGIEAIEGLKEEHDFLKPTESAKSGVRRWIDQGIESAVQSLTAGAPGAVTGAAIGSLFPGPGTLIGGVVGFALGGGTMFGLAEYDSFREEATEMGVPEADAERGAILSGLYEGGFEFASNLLEGWTLGLTKPLTAPAKQTLKAGIKELFKAGMKERLVKMGAVAAAEVPSEMATSGFQAEERYKLGMGNQRFWDAATEAMGPAAVASVIFGGVGDFIGQRERAALEKNLTDPKVDPKRRQRAAAMVYDTLKGLDDTAAKAWAFNAEQAIQNGEAIPIDQSLDLEESVKDILRRQKGEKEKKEAEAKTMASGPQEVTDIGKKPGQELAEEEDEQQKIRELEREALEGIVAEDQQLPEGPAQAPPEALPPEEPPGVLPEPPAPVEPPLPGEGGEIVPEAETVPEPPPTQEIPPPVGETIPEAEPALPEEPPAEPVEGEEEPNFGEMELPGGATLVQLTNFEDSGKKRGDSKNKFQAKVPKKLDQHIGPMLAEVKQGEKGQRIRTPEGEWVGQGSTFPDWMKGQKWAKRKRVEKALDKVMKGEKLGAGETEIVLAALEEANRRHQNDVLDAGETVFGAVPEGQDPVEYYESGLEEIYGEEWWDNDDFWEAYEQSKGGPPTSAEGQERLKRDGAEALAKEEGISPEEALDAIDGAIDEDGFDWEKGEEIKPAEEEAAPAEPEKKEEKKGQQDLLEEDLKGRKVSYRLGKTSEAKTGRVESQTADKVVVRDENDNKLYEVSKDLVEPIEELELKPSEPTPEEKIAEGKKKGELKGPPKGDRPRPEIPDEKIKTGTSGKQKGMFGPTPVKKGETPDMFDEAEEKKEKEAKGAKEKEPKQAPPAGPEAEGGEGGGEGADLGEGAPGGGQAAPPATGGKAPSGQKSKRVRPGLEVASKELLPEPPDSLPAGQYELLGEDQRFSVNLILDAFNRGKPAFMLADGTGVGKTAQLLVAARERANATGKPVLIVTQSDQIITGNFKVDAKKFGVDLDNIEITTYTQLRAGKAGQGAYDTVMFDEAHALKNVDSKQTLAAENVKADHTVFATATPMDRPTAAAYFLSKITGIAEEDLHRQLGFEIKEHLIPGTNKIKRWTVLLPGNDWSSVMQNIVMFRDQAIQDGTMIRREFPFFGNMTNDTQTLSQQDLDEQDRIDAYWEGRIAGARSKNARRNLAGARIQELSRWVEAKKVDWVFGQIMQDLANGYHVVVSAEGVNPTKVQGLGIGEGQYPAFIDELEKKLKADGRIKKWARIFGSGKKADQVELFQSGDVQLAIMTPKSGGTGINLDDTLGDKPRKAYIVTPNFSGDVFQQILGRFSRRKTASPTEIVFPFFEDSIADQRRLAIARQKAETLRRIQRGADLDMAWGFEETGDQEQTGPMVFGEEEGERAPPEEGVQEEPPATKPTPQPEAETREPWEMTAEEAINAGVSWGTWFNEVGRRDDLDPRVEKSWEEWKDSPNEYMARMQRRELVGQDFWLRNTQGTIDDVVTVVGVEGDTVIVKDREGRESSHRIDDLQDARKVIASRLKRGHPVRPEVLADYPDLQPKEEVAPEPKPFAELAQEAADETTPWSESNKVFISDAYETAKEKGYTGTLEDFKAELIKAHRANELDLVGADLVEAMDPEKVKASKAKYLNGRFHFIKKSKEPLVRAQIVHHGTPHVWAPEPGFPHGRPRLDKIGTGEGGAAYGWGFYIAEKESLAKRYMENLSKGKKPEYRGELLLDDELFDLSDAETHGDKLLLNDIMYAIDGLSKGTLSKSDASMVLYRTRTKADRNNVLSEREARQSGNEKSYKLSSFGNRLRKALIPVSGYAKDVDKILAEYTKEAPGSIYQLDIPDDVMPKLLDWDKPLSEQSEYVKKILNKEVSGRKGIENQIKIIKEEIESKQSDLEFDSYSAIERVKALKRVLNKTPEALDSKAGEEIYKILSNMRGGDIAASQYLASIGIPGNTHAGISKGATGAKYVIWDQKVLDRIALLKRNAEKLDAIQEARMKAAEAPSGKPMTAESVSETIAPLQLALNEDEISIIVKKTADDIPERVKKALDKRHPGWRKGDTSAVIFDTGQGPTVVFLIADKIKSPADAIASLFHETRSHYALRRVFDAQGLNNLLDDIYEAKGEQFFQENGLIRDYYGDHWDAGNEQHRRTIAEEYLARIAESGEDTTILQRAYAWLREVLRRLGVNIEVSDADLKNMIAAVSRRALGKEFSVQAIGKNGPPKAKKVKGEERAQHYLDDTITNPAVYARITSDPAGSTLSAELEADRTFVMSLFEHVDPALMKIQVGVQALQRRLQELAGKPSRKKVNLGFGYRPTQRSMQSDEIDRAMFLLRDAGGDWTKIGQFRARAQEQLDNPSEYLKQNKINPKSPIGKRILSKEHRIYLKRILKTLERAEKFGEKEQNFTDYMGELFDDAADLASQHGLLKTFRENYVRRIYRLREGEEAQIGTWGGSPHGFKTHFNPATPRTYDTVLDAMLDGYELSVEGITNSYHEYMKELVTILANKAFISKGMNMPGIDGNNLFTTSQAAKKRGYKKLDATGFQVWQWAGEAIAEKDLPNDQVLTVNTYGKKFFATPPEDVPPMWAVYSKPKNQRADRLFLSEQEAKEYAKANGYTRIDYRRPKEVSELYEKVPLYAPGPIADMVNKVTAKDPLFMQTPFLKTIKRLNLSMKTWILMSSFFHHLAGARSWIFAVHHGWGKKANPIRAYKDGLKKVEDLHPLILLGVKNGLTLGEIQDWSETTLRDSKGLAEKMANKLGLEKTVRAIEYGKFRRERFTDSLFKRFFAGLKAEAFAMEYAHELQKEQDKYNAGKLEHPPNPDLIAEKVARLINADFGGLHRKRMGRNPTLQNIAQLLLLAPDWSESNFRTVTGMVPGVNKFINKMIGDIEAPPGMAEIYRKFWTRIALRIAVSTIIAQMLLNGSDESEEFYDEQMKSNRFTKFRWTEVDVTRLYRALGIDTEGQRKTFSLGGHFFDPLKLLDPFRLIKGKGSPFTRAVTASFSGSDWADRPFTGVKELVTTGKTVKKSPHQPKESGLDRLPAVVLNQAINFQPIQVGHLIRYWQGEEDGLTALMHSAGAATHTAWAPRIETPVVATGEEGEKVLGMIGKLKDSEALTMGPPSRNMVVAGIPHKLSAAEYQEYLDQSSELANKRLAKMMEGGLWDTWTDTMKAKKVKSVISNARKTIRKRIKIGVLRTRRQEKAGKAA